MSFHPPNLLHSQHGMDVPVYPSSIKQSIHPFARPSVHQPVNPPNHQSTHSTYYLLPTLLSLPMLLYFRMPHCYKGLTLSSTFLPTPRLSNKWLQTRKCVCACLCVHVCVYKAMNRAA